MNWVLDMFNKYLVTFHRSLGPLSRIYIIYHTFIFCWITEVDEGKHGSGPQNLDSHPCLANLSAFSLPSMPHCPGTQSSFTLLIVESSNDTNDEEIVYDDSRSSEALLSEHIHSNSFPTEAMYFVYGFPTCEVP
jgi:hypothetical protein